MTFYGRLTAHNSTNVAIVLEKPPSFIVRLNGHRADDMKRILLDFSFNLSKKHNIVAAEG